MEKYYDSLPGLRLSMQILADELTDSGESVTWLKGEDRQCLLGMQFYYGQQELYERYVYLCRAEDLEQTPFSLENGFLIVAGAPDQEKIALGCSCIIVSPEQNLHRMANLLHEIFAKYAIVEKKIQDVLNTGKGLQEISLIAMEYFQRSLFIHDENFNVLACPESELFQSRFTYNRRTGKYMQDMETINNFRVNPLYKQSLKTHGPHIWEGLRDVRSLYINIWNGNTYCGRMIIEEQGKPFQERHYQMASYFAEMINMVMNRLAMQGRGENRPLDTLLLDALNHKQVDEEMVSSRIQALRWNIQDQYICGIISFENTDVTRFSLYSICNDIEVQVPGCYTYYYDGHICFLVNLTFGGIDQTTLRMKMAYIIREGLLTVGVSHTFHHLPNLGDYFIQARIAMEYGREEHSTSWYNEFSTYVLRYWLRRGIGEMHKETICSEELRILKEYDESHQTQLYDTLRVYLTCERNGTLTAQLLNIHRSTLPHRLERISQLTRLNLDHFETRLYLYLSFYMMENGIKK